MNLTMQMREWANAVTIMLNSAAAVGSSSERIIFKYPTVKSKATNGKAITVQILVSGLIV